MCVEIIIDEETIYSVGELRKLLGSDKVISDDGMENNDESCLCNIDIEETAKASGMTCRLTEWGFRFERTVKEIQHDPK